MNTVNLSSDQLAELKRLTDAGKYPDMYLYLRAAVEAENAKTLDPKLKEDLTIAANWLSSASSINANDGSKFSEIVRGSMVFAAASKGRPLSDAEFQKASDQLARHVSERIIQERGFPEVAEIIRADEVGSFRVAARKLELGWHYRRRTPHRHVGPWARLRASPRRGRRAGKENHHCRHAECRRPQPVFVQFHGAGHASYLEVCTRAGTLRRR